MTKPADSDQIARAEKMWREMSTAECLEIGMYEFAAKFAVSERQAVKEDCAKMADQIAKSCSACIYSRKKHGEEPSFCENFGCSSFADLAAAIRSME